MTDFQIKKWYEIKYAEANQTMGVVLLYERYGRFLKKLEVDSNEVIFIEIQQFKIQLAIQHIQTAYFAKAKIILKSVIEQLEKRDFLGKHPKLYNRALLGLLKCEVHFKNALEAERIAKIRINRDYIEEPAYFRNLLWKSNNSYWLKRVQWIAFFGFACAFWSAFSVYYNFNNPFYFGELGVLLISSCWIYYFINKDYLSLTLLEIFTFDNLIRKWLNKRFKLELGKQDDL